MAQRQRIISADSHVTIPREQILAHLPAASARAARPSRGSLRGPAAGRQAPKGACGPSRKRRARRAVSPAMPNMGEGAPWPAAGRPGGHDPIERLKDMDTDGVEAEILYVGAGGAAYYDLGDDHVEAFRAANSAAIEWASVDPKRLMPVYILPIADMKVAVREVERVVAEHAKAVQLPLIPREQGAPPYWDPFYDPLWEALEQHRAADQPACRRQPVPFRGRVCPRIRRRTRASSSRCRRFSWPKTSPTGA